MDLYGFYMGINFNIHDFLGAHRHGNGFMFRVYAPNASRVTLIGDFNRWCEWEMNRVCDNNIWEVFVPGATYGEEYLYRIYDINGNAVEHCDPCGIQMSLRPKFNSILCDINSYTFKDSTWMKKRSDCKDKPLNIYELHLGSWRKPNKNKFYKYDKIADMLIPYLKSYGYNYVELMPITEHPLDESWGYQNTGFFSATSRYGNPRQLKMFIDKCHRNNIGVILDFVPVHFASDEYGLHRFDGTALYEYPHNDVGVSEWGSCNFIHSRGEVRSLLMSAANFWLGEFHFDGLRLDAVSRIIYWHGDEKRGENGNGIDFLRVFNKGLKERYPTCILIAEDSSSFPNVTGNVDCGGLGFDYKWDMGFMNDTLNFFRAAPQYRHEMYHALTFSMMYYYNENYILPFSHDENVHGKATILQKMNGDYEGKFPQGRALYLYMYMHPGKKLNFMGSEFGQLREWDESREQDWSILQYENHKNFSKYMKLLNNIYIEHSALSERDYRVDGFKWIECNDIQNVVYCIKRMSDKETLAAFFNFNDKETEYSSEELKNCKAEILINTDWTEFGGTTKKTSVTDLSVIKLPPQSGILVKL